MALHIRPLLYIGIVASIGLAACTNNTHLSKTIESQSIPADLDKTVLVMERFTHQDPTSYGPYIDIEFDSMNDESKLIYEQEEMQGTDGELKAEHPLIIEANNKLDKYNEDLKHTLDMYKSRYALVAPEYLNEPGNRFEDLATYRYILVCKPVVHRYEDVYGNARFSYRYMYYFKDRVNGKEFPEIEIFSPDPTHALKAIISKLNKAQHAAEGTTAQETHEL